MGRVEIDWPNVRTITSEQRFQVDAASGNAILGPSPPREQASFKLKPATVAGAMKDGEATQPTTFDQRSSVAFNLQESNVAATDPPRTPPTTELAMVLSCLAVLANPVSNATFEKACEIVYYVFDSLLSTSSRLSRRLAILGSWQAELSFFLVSNGVLLLHYSELPKLDSPLQRMPVLK